MMGPQISPSVGGGAVRPLHASITVDERLRQSEARHSLETTLITSLLPLGFASSHENASETTRGPHSPSTSTASDASLDKQFVMRFTKLIKLLRPYTALWIALLSVIDAYLGSRVREPPNSYVSNPHESTSYICTYCPRSHSNTIRSVA